MATPDNRFDTFIFLSTVAFFNDTLDLFFPNVTLTSPNNPPLTHIRFSSPLSSG